MKIRRFTMQRIPRLLWHVQPEVENLAAGAFIRCMSRPISREAPVYGNLLSLHFVADIPASGLAAAAERTN